MNCTVLLNCIIFTFFIKLINSENYKFFPNLRAGEYRLDFKGILRCVPPSSNKIQLNFYLSKTSATTTVIKGNVSAITQLDDTFDLEFKMAIKDSIGGWKDNAFAYKSPKACTVLKTFLGRAWFPFMGGLGFHNASCPISAGNYIATGADTMLIEKQSNFPKEFFYGTYKFNFMFTKNKEVHGCFILVIELKRPWEKE